MTRVMGLASSFLFGVDLNSNIAFKFILQRGKELQRKEDAQSAVKRGVVRSPLNLVFTILRGILC